MHAWLRRRRQYALRRQRGGRAVQPAQLCQRPLPRYDRDFDPVALAKQAGRAHTFDAPPRLKLPQWDWVTYHCKQGDGWIDKIRQTMLVQPATTKWLVHGYEHWSTPTSSGRCSRCSARGSTTTTASRRPRPPSRPTAGCGIVAHYHKLPAPLLRRPTCRPTRASSSKTARARSPRRSPSRRLLAVGLARHRAARRAARLVVPGGVAARRVGRASRRASAAAPSVVTMSGRSCT